MKPVGPFNSHTPGPDCDRFQRHTHMADGSIRIPPRHDGYTMAAGTIVIEDDPRYGHTQPTMTEDTA